MNETTGAVHPTDDGSAVLLFSTIANASHSNSSNGTNDAAASYTNNVNSSSSSNIHLLAFEVLFSDSVGSRDCRTTDANATILECFLPLAVPESPADSTSDVSHTDLSQAEEQISVSVLASVLRLRLGEEDNGGNSSSSGAPSDGCTGTKAPVARALRAASSSSIVENTTSYIPIDGLLHFTPPKSAEGGGPSTSPPNATTDGLPSDL